MKKVLSLVLAFVLMFTICVPVFAEYVGSTPVRVDGSTVGASYTVTIPARVDICWGATYTNIPFTVECHLETGKVLDFDVEGQNGYLLKDGVLGAIPYALMNGNFSLTDSVVPETYVDDVLTIFILPEHWEQVPIDNYADLVTFNVSIKTQ